MSEEFAGIQSNSIDNQHDDSAEKNDALPVGGTSQDVNRNSEGGDYSHPLDSINTITPFSPISSEDNDEKISPLFPENNEEKSSKQSVKQFVKQTKRQSDLSGSSDLSYSTNQLSSKDSLSDADDIDQLGQLVKRPRISTILWCVAIAIVFLASAAFIWFISVQTVLGQSYEEMVIDGFGSHGTPSWLAFCLRPISVSMVVIVTSIIIALVSLIVVCIRKRWWLLGQCAGIIILSAAAEPLKKILPRPMLISIEYLSANSAPSGHTLLKLEVWDSPNSAGIVIDAVRAAKIALDRKLSGPVLAPSSYFMKSPAVQHEDSEARQLVERYIAGDVEANESQLDEDTEFAKEHGKSVWRA